MKINNFKLERFFAKYEFKAPYILCSSDCESLTIKELLSLEKNSGNELDNVWLGYTESQGSHVLRKEITRLYENIHPDNTIVFAGAEEGIFAFMNSVLTEGDHIIAQFPAYQSLYEIANAIGCEVTKWVTNDKNKWELDINFLKKNIKKNTKAIIINCPHNPTGYLMSKEKFRKIISIAKDNNIYLFSDEVYRYSEYNARNMLPAACDAYEKGVSLGVMSKTFGLAGLRIGWIATKDKKLLNDLATFKDYTTICSSAPSEFLSIIALRNKKKLIERNINIIQSNLKLLDKFFKKYKNLFEWVKPKAGTIAFPRIKFDKTAEGFCMDLLNKKGVLLLPGNLYDYDNKHFRIAFGRKNMPQALGKLEEYIKENLM